MINRIYKKIKYSNNVKCFKNISILIDSLKPKQYVYDL